jgi:acetate kinase
VRALLVNAGSSGLKCTLLDSDGNVVVGRAAADWAGASTRYDREGPGGDRFSGEVPWRGHGEAARRAIADLVPAGEGGPRPAGVGHRIVHGGDFTDSVLIEASVRSRIAALADLAPLHNPPSLEALAVAEAALPDLPHVAVFDTSFHRTLSSAARTYAVPERWTREWGLRKYGFHGLSHDYAAGRAAEMLGRPPESLRLVVCHLGHGCSAAAVRGGRSVDTTMGFTPLDGLVMATRSGSVDPGLLLHVLRRHGLSAEEVEDALNRRSGLLGISGLSGDMRDVLAAAGTGDERAGLAVEVFALRVRQAIGALTATLGGIDALVFTGGIGERSAPVRAACCRDLRVLGLELDADANASRPPDADVAAKGSRARILVVAAREDVTMLREVRRVLGK